MNTESREKQAHDLAAIWTRREFDIHTDGIPMEEWDKVDENIRMDKLLTTYRHAYAYFYQQLQDDKKDQ